jgi:hypothetical protein
MAENVVTLKESNENASNHLAPSAKEADIRSSQGLGENETTQKTIHKDEIDLQHYWYPDHNTPRRKFGFGANWNKMKALFEVFFVIVSITAIIAMTPLIRFAKVLLLFVSFYK